MSSFEYIVSNSGYGNPSNSNKLRQFLNLSGTDRLTVAGGFTIDSTLPEQSYPSQTGLGVQPELLILATTHTFGGGGGQRVATIGAAANGKQFGFKLDYPSYLGGRGGHVRISTHSDEQIIPDVAEVNSFDPDGFTLNVPNPLLLYGVTSYSLSVKYFAAQGGGSYDAGTVLGRGSSGLQSVTGLGFQPAAVLLFSAKQTALGDADDGIRFSIGGGDANASYSVWTGSQSHDIYTNMATESGVALMNLQDGNIFLPWSPEFYSRAAVSSLDPDGFTLTWTHGDGVQRYFSYIAVENAELGRWIYNHSSADYFAGTHFTVPTTLSPRGLLFFMGDMGVDPPIYLGTAAWADPTREYISQGLTEGACIGFGACETATTNQWLWTGHDVSRFSPFAGVPLALPRWRLDGYSSSGCEDHVIGGFGLEHIDCGRVALLNVEEGFEGIVGMNYRHAVRRGHRGRFHHSFD